MPAVKAHGIQNAKTLERNQSSEVLDTFQS
jgi:hypothetical protein